MKNYCNKYIIETLYYPFFVNVNFYLNFWGFDTIAKRFYWNFCGFSFFPKVRAKNG